MSEARTCPDCGAAPGHLHTPGCDVERCPRCGGQAISCGCEGSYAGPRLPWTGEWPGSAECREFGWYACWVPSLGWLRCGEHADGAGPDLNRLYGGGATWDAEARRWVRTVALGVEMGA